MSKPFDNLIPLSPLACTGIAYERTSQNNTNMGSYLDKNYLGSLEVSHSMKWQKNNFYQMKEEYFKIKIH